MKEALLTAKKGLFALKVFWGGIMFASTVAAQQWTRLAITDKWGETSTHYYIQNARAEGEGHKGKNVWDLDVVYRTDSTVIFIVSPRAETKPKIIPAELLITEKITVSLRDTNERTQNFTGRPLHQNAMKSISEILYPKSSAKRLAVHVADNGMAKALEKNANLKVLIEGQDWFVRTNIAGNLPAK